MAGGCSGTSASYAAVNEPELYSYIVEFEMAGMTRPLRQVVIAHTDDEARLIFAQRMPQGKVVSVVRDETKE